MSVKAFAVSGELEDYVDRVRAVVAEVCGVPRSSFLYGKAQGPRGVARVAFRRAIQRLCPVSTTELAYLTGLDHSSSVGACPTKVVEALAQVLARMKPFEGPKVAASANWRCPTCGQRRKPI